MVTCALHTDRSTLLANVVIILINFCVIIFSSAFSSPDPNESKLRLLSGDGSTCAMGISKQDEH
jgi:hypothetical protein